MFASQCSDRIHGTVLADETFALRYLGDAGDDRLLVINLGRDLKWSPAADPLLAPPQDSGWRVLWSSEDPAYGGSGTGPLEPQDWVFAGHSAIVLAPEARGSKD